MSPLDGDLFHAHGERGGEWTRRGQRLPHTQIRSLLTELLVSETANGCRRGAPVRDGRKSIRPQGPFRTKRVFLCHKCQSSPPLCSPSFSLSVLFYPFSHLSDTQSTSFLTGLLSSAFLLPPCALVLSPVPITFAHLRSIWLHLISTPVFLTTLFVYLYLKQSLHTDSCYFSHFCFILR